MDPNRKKQVKMALTFYPTVGSRSKFHTSFRRPFSLSYLWNPYSLKRKPCRATPEKQVKRAIIFDVTVGSRSQFHSSFRRPFSLLYL